MLKSNPPTLREILAYRKPTDASFIDVGKHNYEYPRYPKTIYVGSVDNIPEDVLNLKIIAWFRRDGIYISE